MRKAIEGLRDLYRFACCEAIKPMRGNKYRIDGTFQRPNETAILLKYNPPKNAKQDWFVDIYIRLPKW